LFKKGAGSEGAIPKDVCQCVYKSFYPIFKGRSAEEGVKSFLDTVYWTHMAKASLKSLKKDSKKLLLAITRCFHHSFEKEISTIVEKTRLKLIVVASSHALGMMFATNYTKCIEIQRKHLLEYERLLTIDSLVRELNLDKKLLLLGFEECLNCKLAIFPNPSGKAARWKKEFYSSDFSEILHDLLYEEIGSIIFL